MELWNDIYKLYGIVLDLRELLGRLINGRLGEYDKLDAVSEIKQGDKAEIVWLDACMEKDWLPEQLHTIKNLCDTALLLIEHNRKELLPTVLEVLYEQAQAVVDENCVIGDIE